MPALNERERNKKGVLLGLSAFLDFNYFNEAKYFDFKISNCPIFIVECGLSNSTKEKNPGFIILLTPMYNSAFNDEEKTAIKMGLSDGFMMTWQCKKKDTELSNCVIRVKLFDNFQI